MEEAQPVNILQTLKLPVPDFCIFPQQWKTIQKKFYIFIPAKYEHAVLITYVM